MSSKSRVHVIRLPLRKIGAALPAVALISGGIVMSASAAPTGDQVHPASTSSPVVVVPSVALTMPSTAQALADPAPVHPATTPLPAGLGATSLVPMVPPGTAAGSSSMVTLDSSGIPVRALEGYRDAATLIGSADRACHLDWALLAAIGRVESDHARFGGNQLDSAGVARPGIIGIALDGSNGTARIMDTDHGRLDRDTTYDRAVGPMQFIPSSWAFAGVDANGDGVKDPENMADSAAATGRYLCSGPGDLRRPDDLRSAILRYNASDAYVSMVTAIANAYRQGVTALPAVDLAPARPSTVASRTASAAITPAPRHTPAPAPKSPANKPPVSPATPAPTTSTPPTSTPPTTQTTTPTGPPTTTPTAPPTTTPTTTPTCEPATSPTGSPTTSTQSPTSAASPGTTEPCVPAPCVPATATASTDSPTETASPTAEATPAACTPAATTAEPSTTTAP